MKKTVVGLLISAICISLLAGCQSTADETSGTSQVSQSSSMENNTENETLVTNEEIATAIKAGLVKRWDIFNNDSRKDSETEEYIDYLNDCLDAEIDELSKYENESFEDSETEDLVKTYIDSLKDEKEVFSDFLSHVTLNLYNYSVINTNRRNPTLISLVDKLGIEFNEEEQTNYQTILEADDTYLGMEEIEDVFTAVEVRDFQNDYDTSYSCEIKIKNETPEDFERAGFTIRFYDADGVELYEDIQYHENIEANSEFWLQLYCDSQDEPATVKFVGYDIEEKDTSGAFDYLVVDDCKTVSPVELEL